jgi:hypothetical protein
MKPIGHAAWAGRYAVGRVHKVIHEKKVKAVLFGSQSWSELRGGEPLAGLHNKKGIVGIY